MMSDIAFKAMEFAREAHKTQRRKYTGNPCADHLAEVAGIVATVTTFEPAIAVAWLHDTVEDQGVTERELIERFGYKVLHGEMLLSDLETGKTRVHVNGYADQWFVSQIAMQKGEAIGVAGKHRYQAVRELKVERPAEVLPTPYAFWLQSWSH